MSCCCCFLYQVTRDLQKRKGADSTIIPTPFFSFSSSSSSFYHHYSKFIEIESLATNNYNTTTMAAAWFRAALKPMRDATMMGANLAITAMLVSDWHRRQRHRDTMEELAQEVVDAVEALEGEDVVAGTSLQSQAKALRKKADILDRRAKLLERQSKEDK